MLFGKFIDIVSRKSEEYFIEVDRIQRQGGLFPPHGALFFPSEILFLTDKKYYLAEYFGISRSPAKIHVRKRSVESINEYISGLKNKKLNPLLKIEINKKQINEGDAGGIVNLAIIPSDKISFVSSRFDDFKENFKTVLMYAPVMNTPLYFESFTGVYKVINCFFGFNHNNFTRGKIVNGMLVSSHDTKESVFLDALCRIFTIDNGSEVIIAKRLLYDGESYSEFANQAKSILLNGYSTEIEFTQFLNRHIELIIKGLNAKHAVFEPVI